MLNEHNTVFARSGPLYGTGVSLGSELSTKTTCRNFTKLSVHVNLSVAVARSSPNGNGNAICMNLGFVNVVMFAVPEDGRNY